MCGGLNLVTHKKKFDIRRMFQSYLRRKKEGERRKEKKLCVQLFVLQLLRLAGEAKRERDGYL